eukprot:gene28975-32162_t
MSAPRTTLRVGIICCANIAKKTCIAISIAEGMEVVAVGSRDVEKAEFFIQKMSEYLKPGVAACNGYAAVIARPDVDCVYIPLPTSLHVEWVKKAAAAGKHVMLEKPIAMNLSEVEEMVNACVAANVQLMDGTMMTHAPRTRMMERAIADKANFGDVMSVTATFTFLGNSAFNDNNIRIRKDLDGLGATGDLGWYCIRAALWAFRWELPETVMAHPGSDINAQGVVVSGSATLVWKGSPKRKATIDFGFNRPLNQTLQVAGKSTTLTVRDYVIPTNDRASEFELAKNHALSQYDLADVTQRETKVVKTSKTQEAYMWETFGDSVRDIKRGGKPNFNWFQIAVVTQRVVLAVHESIINECAIVTVASS